MIRRTTVFAFSLALLASGPVLSAESPAPAATAGTTRLEGLAPVYLDKAKGRILVALPAPDVDGVSGRYLYLTALRTGLGSAPVGLDRAAAGPSQILVFRRIGKKVFAELENPRFRAEGAPTAEALAAKEAFATSTIWAGDVAGTDAQGRVLVDLSSFLTRDVMGASQALQGAGEKGYRLVPDLSVADPDSVKVFPENIEFEARQTFVSDTPGPEVRNIAPDAKAITLQVRHSLVKLPEPGYERRSFDPRTGGFDQILLDFAAPLGSEIVQRLSVRFRLEKVNPGPAPSPVKKPIIFYVDRAAPEPIRSALVEGAGWWAQGFEAAGYQNAFRVEVMPEGTDPLDVRYNVINWVDRATRGWSYGQAVSDPRTGEIIKGSVLLGALRVRQDMLIFEGLVGADKNGTGGPNDPVQVSLARLRQLGAHEVGHALGLAHNFAASTQDRASVMDYPAPRVKLTEGKIDLSDAYGVGLGSWDRFTIDWLYGPADKAALDAKAATMIAGGTRFITDADSRSPSVAQPWGSLWDDGADAAAELTRLLAVRQVALNQFGLGALKPGEPVVNLKRKLVPVYLLHRYQTEATAKLVGGVAYSYAVKGDAAAVSPPVAATEQRAALSALLSALDPAGLDLKDDLIGLLSSGQSGENDRQYEIEVMPTIGGPVFDPLVAADVAAGLVIDPLTQADRLARLVEQTRRDPAQLGAAEVLDQLIARVFSPATGRQGEIARRVQTRLVLNLAATARKPSTSPAVAALAEGRLEALASQLKKAPKADAVDRAHRLWLARLIADPGELARHVEARPETPPGMPIGGE